MRFYFKLFLHSCCYIQDLIQHTQKKSIWKGNLRVYIKKHNGDHISKRIDNNELEYYSPTYMTHSKILKKQITYGQIIARESREVKYLS